MTLKEYSLGDRTYLFDDEDVPEGAKLIGDIKPTVSTHPYQVPEPAETDEPKRGRQRANKQAPAPDDKSDAHAESTEDAGISDEY